MSCVRWLRGGSWRLTGVALLPSGTGDLFPEGKYIYKSNLQALDSFRPLSPVSIPESLAEIRTPLKADVWAEMLRGHPDKEFTKFLLKGIQEGFRIGFDYASHSCKRASGNMASAVQNPEVHGGAVPGQRTSNGEGGWPS